MALGTHHKAFNLYVDGVGYGGEVLEVTPPKSEKIVTQYRSGAMTAPVDIVTGHVTPEISFKLNHITAAAYAAFNNSNSNKQISFTLRAAVAEYGSSAVKKEIHACTGFVKMIDRDAYKPGEFANATVTATLTRWSYSIDDAEIHKFDAYAQNEFLTGDAAAALAVNAIIGA